MEKRELLPFKQLLPMADSVMVGHLRVDAIDRKRAASLSFKVTTGLLRRKLGFKNAIVTDALMMGGVTSHLSDEQAIESAVNAGADILLFPCDPEQAVQKVRSMVSSGELAETELDERVKRILRMKVCCGLFRSRKPSYERAVDVLKRGSTRKVMRDIAEKSITLVKNVGQVLPLKTNAVHYLKIHDESAGDTPDLFESEIQKYCDLREDADVVLLAVFFKPRPFAGKTKIDRKRIGRVVSCIGKRKAVVVALGSPYVVRQFMGLEGWVCAFSGASESQEAAAKAIFGKIPFKGISPVRI
jgi:beta-N-acetylhexosaminidase